MKNILETLITDRIPADAERLLEMDRKGWARMTPEERAEYRAGPKGGYCHTDINRVTGAMEYLDGLMAAAGAASGYSPVRVSHVGSGGRTWTDTVWIDYDKPSPGQWAAHLENVRQFWAYVRTIEADILPRYDPHGLYSIRLDEVFTAGDICEVTACCGLLRLIVEVNCDPAYITAQGDGWDVERTADGLRASFFYPGWLFEDVQKALKALRFSCTAGDGIFDVSVTFRAELRYGAEKALGTCMARWSSHITWGGARVLYGTWGGTTDLDWHLFERGEAPSQPYTTAARAIVKTTGLADTSYYVPLMPDAREQLNVYKANAIEENLHYLIRQWPAFEVETVRALIGDYGTVFVPEPASPAQGVEVTLLQHLPRLLVLVEGEGLEHISWAGEGWTAQDGDGLALAYMLDGPSEQAANAALVGLAFTADWNADVTISLAAEREDGTLRIIRRGLTQMLFRAEMTWGRLGRERGAWAELDGETWAQARSLKKE